MSEDNELIYGVMDWHEKPRSRPSRLGIRLRHLLFRYGEIRRVHIVGCARSGTTMLQYAMSAFEGVTIHDEETSVTAGPPLSRALGLVVGNLGKGRRHFVTKRNYHWFERGSLNALIERTLAEDIFLIRIIRDPRDVLTSHHKTEARRYYVEPERWLASVGAERYLFEQLHDHPGKLTLRYEDMVCRPEGVELVLRKAIGLRRRQCVDSWAMLKTNVNSLKRPETDLTLAAESSPKLGEAFDALHNLRDFDPRSVGRWRSQDDSIERVRYLLEDSEIRAPLRDFMIQNGYF